MANDLVMANDLDDLDGADCGPQPPQGRELVIVDLGHMTMMPGSACLAGAAVTRRGGVGQRRPAK
jgi:hypothetical protein